MRDRIRARARRYLRKLRFRAGGFLDRAAHGKDHEAMAAAIGLTAELIDFLESGVSILVATRDALLRPQCLRGMGAKVGGPRGPLTLYMPELVAEKTLANVRDNGRIAITFSRPIDHRSVQVKGRCTGIRACDERDHIAQERYRAAFVEQLHAVGMPRAVSRRIRLTPSVAAVVEIEELYEQTPGPRAGRPLENTGP
jgi:hypothetical protein